MLKITYCAKEITVWMDCMVILRKDFFFKGNVGLTDKNKIK